MIDGHMPFGCDGSRVECPRAAELEARLGKGSKEASAPTTWVTAFVHLGLGLLWSWHLGKGTADERLHLRQMLSTTPPQALVVADAAYLGYELASAILGHKRSYLLRLSSKNRLYAIDDTPFEEWQDGQVYYWPETRKRTTASAVVPAHSHPGHGTDEKRRLAADEHSRLAKALGEDGGKVLPLEVEKRRSVQNLQADAQEIQTRQSFGEAHPS